MITNMILSVLFLLCLTTSTTLTDAEVANKQSNSLSLKLLHRSSISSFENENFQDFLEKNRQNSLKDSKFVRTAPMFQATTTYVYFVKLYIGVPPVAQYLAVDIGSSLVWVEVNARNKRYYYRRGYSRTYKDVNCTSPECSLSPDFSCTERKDHCQFVLNYANSINRSFGFLGLERFGFPDGNLEDVLFGAATATSGRMLGSPNFNGMLGLGSKPPSLLRSFSRKKITYCIDDIFNSSSTLSFLELGDNDDYDFGDYTMYVPLIHGEHYRIDMECIEFMEICLAGFNIFKYDGNDPYTGVIFDTGAILTFLADEAYDALANNVARAMRSEGFVEPQNKDIQMCYEGQKEEVSDFPPVSFRFANKDINEDLRLTLDGGNLFYNPDSSTFCLTVIKSSSMNILFKRFTVIGLMAQQKHTIVLDLDASKVSIKYTSCQS